MNIHNMTASFGKLENESLALGDGLNIIYAPNEGGKSTWCGFLKAMLYGIDSAAREKGGIKPDKVLYAPWSGAPMSGSMEISYDNQKITLLRRGRETAPMRDFSAVYTGSSDPVRGLDGKTAGETLLGVSRDVFERTAFIGQGKIGLSSSPELEKRIAAIVQTGEEDASVTESADRLRAALRRRRYNKSGRLPELEREMGELLAQLEVHERETGAAADLERAKAAALERRNTLLERVSETRKDARRRALDALTESRGRVRELEQRDKEAASSLDRAETQLDAGHFGRTEPEHCREAWNKDARRLAALDSEAQKGGSNAFNWGLLAFFMLVTLAFELLVDFKLLDLGILWNLLPRLGFGLLAVGQLLRMFRLRKRRGALLREGQDILSSYSAGSAEDVSALLDRHESAFSVWKAAERESLAARARLETALREQEGLEAGLLRDLDFSEGKGEAAHYTRLLEEAEAALRQLREQAALREGRQSMLLSPEDLREQQAALQAEHKRLSLEHEALSLALEQLLAAGEEISHRITPVLSARTAELFSRLTGGRYSSILLDKQLQASAQLSDSPLPREAGFLSTGAADQLYLAVRLALCELALPAEKACPIVLDDALANFDDGRCAAALALLHELSQERQILLFTCHRREAAMAASYSGVSILELL